MLDLTDLKEAEKKATPGEWCSDACGDVWTNAEKEYCPGMEQNIFRTVGSTRCGPDRGDSVFIALFRNLCRPMIEEIESLRIQIAMANEQVHQLQTDPKKAIVYATLNKLRTELAKAQTALAYCAHPDKLHPQNNAPELVAREALRSIDESGVLR